MGSAAAPAAKKELPEPPQKIAENLPVERQPAIKRQNLPVFDGTPGRKYSDQEINDILDYLLTNGAVPEGTARERMQRNYPRHRRLAERAERLLDDGQQLHAKFNTTTFWRKWEAAAEVPLPAGFLKRLPVTRGPRRRTNGNKKIAGRAGS